ncbi:MAG: hypothetical protein FWD44_02705 [Oscillospiraceae bacterium]|nr:hypothetical protein [Oscillospiraceae bacterium]
MKLKVFSLCLALIMLLMCASWFSYDAGASGIVGVNASMDGFNTVSAGPFCTFAIKKDNSLWGWGFGYLGDGNDRIWNEPVLSPIKIMDKAASVLTLRNYTMVIKTDGSLWAWGKHDILGDGVERMDVDLPVLSPVKILDSVVYVTATDGGGGNYAIKADGSLWAWGRGVLGNGNDSWSASVPTPIKIMDDVVSISSNGSSKYAVKTDNSLWAWGANTQQQQLYYPTKIMDDVSFVSAHSYYRTMVIKTDGSLWAWGREFLGDGVERDIRHMTRNPETPPVEIMSSVMFASSSKINMRDISSAVAIQTDGSLWTWGDNRSGKIGDDTITVRDERGDIKKNNDRTSPVKIMENVNSVIPSGSYNIAIKTDNSLWAWGSNFDGQLGDGTVRSRLSPVKIMDGVVAVTTFGFGDGNFTIDWNNVPGASFAILQDGSLWAWGNNRNGQLGDGTQLNRLSPVKIMDNVMIPQNLGISDSNNLPLIIAISIGVVVVVCTAVFYFAKKNRKYNNTD